MSRTVYLRRLDVVGHVPYAISSDSSVKSDVQFCAIRQSDTLQFGGGGADCFVFELIAAFPVHHVAIQQLSAH